MSSVVDKIFIPEQSIVEYSGLGAVFFASDIREEDGVIQYECYDFFDQSYSYIDAVNLKPFWLQLKDRVCINGLVGSVYDIQLSTTAVYSNYVVIVLELTDGRKLEYSLAELEKAILL